jgi:ERF superfamily
MLFSKRESMERIYTDTEIEKILTSILEKLEAIGKRLDHLEPSKHEIDRSFNTGQIYSALAKAQGEYKKLKANERANTGKYFANLEAVLEATRDALAKYLIMFSQNIKILDEGSGAALLITKLGHESGEWIASYARVMVGKTDYATGYAYEIHKRLHALMLLGIAPSANDPIAHDDDGDDQSERRIVDELLKPKVERDIDRTLVISKEQYDNLNKELDIYPTKDDGDYMLKKILETHEIETLADLPKDVYPDVLLKLKEVRINITSSKSNKR